MKISSSDGVHTLTATVYEPEHGIRGIVQTVHGKSEHIGRYAHFMEQLANEGYVACGYNHIGHAGTSPEDELGFFGYDSGYRHIVNDINKFGLCISEKYPDKKRYVFAHSMGSFAARLAVLNDEARPHGLILCGTGGPRKFSNLGLLLCDAVTLLRGGKHVSQYIEKLVFSEGEKHFEGENAWLTSDKSEVDKFNADRYCGFPFTVCAMHDLIKMSKLANKSIWPYAISRELPIFLISGADDPIGDFGHGVQTVFDRLEKAGCNVKMKLYPNARHELLNEFCKDEVTADVLDFIKSI